MPGGRRRFRYDDEDRKAWQDPCAILESTGLGPGMVFIDLGCGEGFFAIPAASIVGEEGQVFALDINPASIDHLREAAGKEGLGNITAAAGEGEETVLCDECGDIVFFGTVLHDFTDPSQVLANARAMVKPTGRLINLDWKKEDTGIGPPLEIRFSEATASRFITEAGFIIKSVKDSGPRHYLIEAEPEPEHGGS